MTRVDEKIAVSVNQGGEPIGFRWRNQSYLVNAKPVRWFARREWWVEAARAQRGIGAGVLELEMWRLQASCVERQKPLAQYELIHSFDLSDKPVSASPEVSEGWRLVRVYE